MKGYYKKGIFNVNKGAKAKNLSKAKEIQINFFLIDRDKIGIQIPYGYCFQQIKNCIKNDGEGMWNMQDKCWTIKRSAYNSILDCIQDYFFKVNNQQQNDDKIVKVNPIQQFVFKAQDMLKNQLSALQIVSLKPYNNVKHKYSSIQTKIEPQSLPFYKKLFDFQKQSLKFGINKHGRLLLADQMGVGKTIQSLAVAYIYKHEWPLLIICPPTLKINWQNQIKRWYPDIQPSNIQLINTSKTAFRNNVSIMIVSYDLAWRIKDMFNQIKIVIADQAHYLKSPDSKRSQVLVPFLSSRKRVILLTGTPAFARPKQIFNLISIVRPNLFKTFKSFGNRYCDPKYNHWSHTYQYNGCKNVKQLHYILKGNIMIRRLKAQVLTELPDKNRQKIILQTDPSIVKNIKQVLQKNNIQKMQTFFSEYMNSVNSIQTEDTDKRQQIMLAYRMSGLAKIKAVKQYISQILENNVKILVFAHHIKILDQIQAELKNKKHKFMRIDGSVSHVQRANNVQKFQNDPQILVALLSITAASVGITLTAASTVIFVQLHWTPALMIQAEDRAHRVGQKNSVNCHYLLGENTLDQMLYKFLQKKVLNVSSFVDGKSKDLNFQELRKGQKGKVSKRDQNDTTNIRKCNFGYSMLQKIQYRNNEIQGNTQQTDISDISISTEKDKPSRKKTSTLDYYFNKPSKLRNSIIPLKQDQKQEELSGVKTHISRQKKQRNEKQQNSQLQKLQIDSDQQFQKALKVYFKEKKQTNSISNSISSSNKNNISQGSTQSLIAKSQKQEEFQL